MDRSWLKPFDPKVNSAYSEGNAYQYMFVPHDVDGLKKLAGGDNKFATWLDSLFYMPSKDTLMIGQYWHGNEPGHHLPYLFDYVGEPWKTQYLTHKILTKLYRNTTDGLAGNEDCGQMSAWYIFSAMGFYPVNPSELKYQFGSPVVQEARLQVANGKYFTMKAPMASVANKYIQAVTLNGQKLDRTYITHQEIMDGGTLEFTMGAEPNKTLFK